MSQHSPAHIGLLFDNVQLAASLTAQLDHLISYIVIQVYTSIEEIVPQKEMLAQKAGAPAQDNGVFLVSDWKADALFARCKPEQFAAVIFVGAQNKALTLHPEITCIEADGQMGEEVVAEIISRLFPGHDEKQRAHAYQYQKQLQLLEHIGKELSVFYHNISNPLTILSGNIQLLQMLTDNMSISSDLMKPIMDIAIVSTRFEQDLKAIVELREKIRAGSLQNSEM